MIYKELVPNPKDRIMCVKVGKVKRENLYEMIRKILLLYCQSAKCAMKEKKHLLVRCLLN